MREYTFTEARQHFAALLEEAKKDGKVCIKKKNGEMFYIQPAISRKSPLDVKGFNLGLSADEIVDVVRESRERNFS